MLPPDKFLRRFFDAVGPVNTANITSFSIMHLDFYDPSQLGAFLIAQLTSLQILEVNTSSIDILAVGKIKILEEYLKMTRLKLIFVDESTCVHNSQVCYNGCCEYKWDIWEFVETINQEHWAKGEKKVELFMRGKGWGLNYSGEKCEGW